jgi:hypothetical protein
MNKLMLALKSRTVWTVVLLVLINSVPVIKNAFPNAAWLDTVNTLLTLLAGYFHVNPSQQYQTPPNA